MHFDSLRPGTCNIHKHKSTLKDQQYLKQYFYWENFGSRLSISVGISDSETVFLLENMLQKHHTHTHARSHTGHVQTQLSRLDLIVGHIFGQRGLGYRNTL